MAKDEILTMKEAVYRLQTSLLEGAKNENQLSAAGSLMSRGDYQDLVTERVIAKICGYPLCSNNLNSERPSKGRYRISLKEHKVYDVQETYSFCSSGCLINSRAFSIGLPDERTSDLDPIKLNEVLKRFDGFGANSTPNMGRNEDLGLSQLRIMEKENIEAGEVSSNEWIGPSDAIDGYVPRRDRNSNTLSSKQKKGESRYHLSLQVLTSIFPSDMSFTSVIIDQNEYSIAKTTTPSSSKQSGESNEKVIPEEDVRPKQSPDSSVANIKGSGFRNPSKRNGRAKIDAKLSASEDKASENGGEPKLADGDKSAQGAAVLKSSLKTSYSKETTTRTVSWADVKAEDGQNLETVCEMNDPHGGGISRETSSVESHKTASTKASKDAPGKFLLTDFNEGEIFTEAILKWPPKPGFSEADLVESDDTLYDRPPDGFNLSLSPFCTLFNSLFSWISSSSLAYIYGKDDSFHEEYVNANGREYPCKVVAEDGRSSEIKQTLSAALARALPGVVSELRLPTPISILEQGMGRLLDTMSFIDPLPSLRTKQWQAIVLLFLNALSVSRIPALSKYLEDRRASIQKVLEGAGIGVEEFEVMKDLIIPLG
ncbi:hypothetical protein M569_10314, partial [Genlisea aurea]